MSLVLDNSVSMRWCFADSKPSDAAYADRTLGALEDRTCFALVPALWTLETANVLARAEAQKLIEKEQSAVFLARLRALRIEIDPATADHALSDTLDIARRYRVSAYDAAYLELAVRMQLPLATLDTDLRKAARRAGAELF